MKNIIAAVEKYRNLILDAQRFIWQHPETGYKEFVTSKYMADKFTELGYELTYAEGLTGFYTRIETGREGPEVLILGELDSIICPAHPDADKTTGAVHSCGHNAQCAALLGIAAALREPEVLAKLSGSVRLCAVPAEELLEIEYRRKLRDEGKIKYFGGKTEFLSRGYFDGVDMAFMVHTAEEFGVNKGSVGCVAKNVIYKGRAAHAGGAPWNGVNALYAANCGINAINSIRETFKEADIMRVHPIITHGGDMVNAIPETVRLESYVRGSSYDAILRENKKINRALIGAALSLGANVEIIDIPGYAPLYNCDAMAEVLADTMAQVLPGEPFSIKNVMGSGSTDMGDLSQIIPTLHPYAGGKTGKDHGNNYYIADPEKACVGSAKMQLGLLLNLLGNGAGRAKKIISEFKPIFASKEDYLAFIDSINSSGDRIVYSEGAATVKL